MKLSLTFFGLILLFTGCKSDKKEVAKAGVINNRDLLKRNSNINAISDAIGNGTPHRFA